MVIKDERAVGQKTVFIICPEAGISDHDTEPDQYVGEFSGYDHAWLCEPDSHGGFVSGKSVYLCAVLLLLWTWDRDKRALRPILWKRRPGEGQKRIPL